MKTIDTLKKLIREEIESAIGSNIGIEIMTLPEFLKSSLNEAEGDLLGAPTSTVSDKDMADYLKRSVDKEKTAGEKYSMPYVHSGNVEIKDQDGREINTAALKKLLKTRPDRILKQNEKLAHSGGGYVQFFNIGLPALKGLAVNEKTDEFVVVDTCPGAGVCKIYCYARKGGYVQWKNSSLHQSKVLNMLLNDPEGFKAKLSAEISALKKDFKEDDGTVSKIKNVIRWHDAGDFFSPQYLELAYSIARKFPDVDFYAYTKIASVAQGNKPDNFLINFSMGAKKEEEKKIDFTKTKSSIVVQKDLFQDLLAMIDTGKKGGKPSYERDEKGRAKFKDENSEIELKKRISAKYGVPVSSLLTYDELQKTPESDEVAKYNVIVRPKDGDDSASRSDVLGTYLLIH